MHAIDECPTECLTCGVIRYTLRDYPRGYVLTYWGPRMKKGKSLYFLDQASRAAYIPGLAEEIAHKEALRSAVRADQKAREAQWLAQSLENYQVGQILVNSWGYDQTNVDYYEIVERKGRMVKLRPIAGRTVKEGEFMSDTVSPVPGAYVGDEVITKRIGPYGIRMECGSARPCQPTDCHHRSWYH